MGFLIGFIVAWAIIGAVLLASEKYEWLGITLLCKNSIYLLLTLPVSLPIIAVSLLIHFIKVAFHHIKLSIRTA